MATINGTVERERRRSNLHFDRVAEIVREISDSMDMVAVLATKIKACQA